MDRYKKTFGLMVLLLLPSLIYVPYLGLNSDGNIRSRGYDFIFELNRRETIDITALLVQVVIALLLCFVIYLFKDNIDRDDSGQS